MEEVSAHGLAAFAVGADGDGGSLGGHLMIDSCVEGYRDCKIFIVVRIEPVMYEYRARCTRIVEGLVNNESGFSWWGSGFTGMGGSTNC